MKCPFCGADVSSVYYSTTCPSCSKALHTCMTCSFYSPSAHYGCRENVDELVQDKNRPNFCDSFRLTDRQVTAGGSAGIASKAEDVFNSFFNI